MPYTSEELRGIDFYTEFLNKKERAYLERVTRSAYNGFKRDDGTLVSYEAIDNGLGFEDANLETSGVYLVKETRHLFNFLDGNNGTCKTTLGLFRDSYGVKEVPSNHGNK